MMDTNTELQDILVPLDEEQTYYPPRPSAEYRFYSITVGRKPGVYRGTYVVVELIFDAY
jgi:hypothetical protein